MIIRNKKYPLLIILSVITLASLIKFYGVIINITPSIKEGIYIKSIGPLQKGDIIAFCLTGSYETLGLNRGYIELGKKCGASDPLIKQIIAMPGDTIILNNNYITVNNRRLPYPTLHSDTKGRPLQVYPRGIYANTTGYWLIGGNAYNSWDSRYWGDIKESQILYKLRPLIIW